MIFRDDDPSITTDVNKFAFVHDIFHRYGVTHTVALIMKDIEKNAPLVNYLNDHRGEIDIQLHCWEHVDYAKLVSPADEFEKAITAMQRIFGVTPTVWYPPWNSTNERCNQVARGFGLTPRPDKISLDQYIRKNGHVKEDTINFHYWYEPEVNDLHKALPIYISRK